MEFIRNFQKKAAERPNDIALSNCGDTVITYHELDEMSGRVYRYLKDHGIGREDFVNILLPRGVEPLIAVIGVWKAGAAFVLLEDNYPAERVAFIQKDCGCKLILDSIVWQEILQYVPLPGFEEPDDHDAAFAVYTSGSTGNPKGVLHEYGNIDLIAASLNIALLHFGLIAPLNFVATIFFFCVTMHSNGTMYIIPFEIVKNPPALTECFVRNDITQTFCAPSIYALFRNIPCLELIIVSSEPAYGIWSETSELLVCNVYGMSESGFLVAVAKLDTPNEIAPIGKPQFDLDVALKGEDGNTVANDESGEICFPTPFVRGYINHPNETETAFSGGIFHTRDLGKRLPNGDLIVIGRMDDMIKINGNRVEPAEIENVFRRITGMKQVIAKGFAEGENAFVCVYYTDNAEIDTEQVRAEMMKTLPYYMIPSRFIKLDKLPRTQSGKLSRSLLPKPETETVRTTYTAPANPTEKLLCDSMAQILGLVNVGADEDFYELGGSSVSSMKLIVSCPLEGLDIGMIFAGRTPQKIASLYLETRMSAASESLILDDPQRNFPLTQTQLGIYLECERREGEAVYNNPYLSRFPADTPPEKLRNAAEAAVKAHPGLFARIVTGDDGMPAMIYCPELSDTLLCNITKTTEERFALQKETLVKPSNIKADRLFRLEIFTTEAAVYLFMDFHHIIYDGTSAHILMNDMITAWNGNAPETEKYTAYHCALDEKAARETQLYQRAKTWYLERFGETESVALPEGDVKEKELSYGEIKAELDVSPEEIRTFCEKQKITENIVVTAAFGFLLSAYTRSADAAFATIYNGRKDLRTDRTVSMLVKTLPVLCRTTGKLTVKEYLSSLKEQLLGAMANDIFSFAEVAAATGISSDVLFAWQDEMHDDSSLRSMGAVREKLPFNATGDALSIDLVSAQGKLVMKIQFHRNKYSEAYIETMARCYGNVLRGVLSKERLDEINLVSGEEEEKILSLSKGETLGYDRRGTWVDLFRSQSEKTPERNAVIDSEGSFTYRELDRVSDSIAAYLLDSGVKPNTFVAIKMGRSKLFTAAVLGIHKAGAAYLPIDADYPEERIAYMLEDSEASIVLTEDTIKIAISEYQNAKQINFAETNNLAYMIYTSGSTGKPKGVMIPHRAMLNFVHFIRYRWKLTENSRISCHSNFSFDASVEDLYPALTVGGCVFIVPEKERHDIFEMRKYISANSINGGCYTTQFGQLLSDKEPLVLDYLCVGGEAMTSVPNVRGAVFNTYGPTEFTVDATYFELDKSRKYDNIPIGIPLTNCYAFIVGLHGELLPRGIAGELCLAGPQIAEGYWKREELTAEKFVDCPYLEGQKMYRTGDLARYNEEGQLEYLGRIDTQVKLRGFRIELGEIESRASQFAGIRSVAAEVRKDNLVLYYVSDNETDNDELKAFLSESLTEYMIPTVYVRLPEMPMTPNGKIDRKALPEPEIISDEEIIAPETETEKKLFETAAEILRTNKFGITSNLVSLGLSSLGAMRLAGAIEQRFGVRISVSVIMQKPEIKAIAAVIDSNDIDTHRALAPYAAQETYPITENQRGIIVDWQMKPDTTQYNIPSIVVYEHTDGEKLAKAVRTVINAHGYLKVRFEYSGDDTVQRRNDNEAASVTVESLTQKPDSTFFQSRIKPFDLFKDRLYRAEIYTYEDTAWLFMDMHHTIYDGFSDTVFRRDLHNALEDKPIENEEFTAFDYALYERERTESEEYAAAEKYFDVLVSDTVPARIPDSDKADGTAEGVVTVSVDAANIDEFCRRNGVTPSSFLQAAFAEVLSRITREEKVMYTTVSSGRSADTALQNCVGMFVRTLPVVGIKSADMTAADYVRAMHKQLNTSYDMDIYPYTKLVEKHHLYADMMFVYQEGMAADISYSGQEELSLDEVKMPLSVDAWKENDSYVLYFEYDGRKYGTEDISRLGNAIKNAAEGLAQEQYVKDIRLVSDEEQKAVLSLSKGETLGYDRRGTWVDLFRSQSEKTPERNAVTDSEGSFTYRELDSISDSIAAYLLDNGVKPNTFIAVKMGRSKLFLAAVLGIHKAGAAYLPIDADYPEERIAYMLEDSEASIVLTEDTVKIAISEYQNAKQINFAETNNLAYMIYTSGSTGKPKGVMIPHRAMLNFVHFIRFRWKLTENSRIACHSNFSFDASVEDLYPALTVGGCVFIVPEKERHDIFEMRKYISANSINGGCYTTQFGQLLSDKEPLVLDYLCVGGEAMTSVPNVRGAVFNTYGPTEFTVDATYFELDKSRKYDNIPIGIPLTNCYAFIVGLHSELLPRGIAGELCLAGPQIAEGYWKREELTAEKFVDCPYLEGQKMYRTGDLARYNEEGQLEYLGRIDTQVKLRGFRIELGEIESRASQFAGIRSVAANVRKDYLVLYYTSENEIESSVLKAFLSESLTEYMVPSVYMRLPEMPMTPNGKIDRKALPEPSIGGRSAYVEPATEKERTVAEIMGTILGVSEPVSAEDSFFELGGDSIKAIRMVSLLREKSVQVSVAGIMKNKTVRGIAADAVIETAAVISQEPFEGYIKDTAIIAYFNDLGLPEPWHYNQAQLYSLAGRAELRTLQKAWDSLTYQHDMLRAVVRDGRIFVRSADIRLEIEEHSAADNSEITAICSKIQSHIDMREALVRAALIHGEDTDYLFIAAHHLVIDGVSWRIIRSDLEAAYSQAVSGTEIKLPAKTNTYNDFAQLQHRYRDSYKLTREIPYWTAVQKKLEALPCSAAKAHDRRFEHITVFLNEQETYRFLHTNFGILKTDINDALLTAVGAGYRALTGEDSVSVQLEGHGREDMGEHLITDRTVGWFTSMYPVVLEDLNGDVRHDLLTVKETLHRVPNKGVGYNVLRYLEGKENIPVQPDRMEKILFNYLGDMGGENSEDTSFFRDSDIFTGESVSSQNNGDPDLTINCIVINGRFELRLDYNADIFGGDDAEKFAGSILSEMKRITDYLAECDTPAVTASDLGETEWAEEEFEKIMNEFAARGERLERIYPLLPMQEGMLFKNVSEPDSLAYRMADIYEADAVFTEEQLRRVLERLGKKHEVLRTAIIYRGVGQPRQAIVDRQLGLTMLDISDSADPENELALIRRNILKNGFDLQEKPLFGLTCVKSSPEHSYIIVSVHHAVIDGWCSSLYMNDLDRYLSEALSGVETKDEDAVSGRYEKAVREILDKDKNAGLKYWRDLLSGYETQARIPSYGIVPMNERSSQNLVATYIDEETTSRLTEICREADATVSNGAELVWGLVNAVCSRTEDVVFAKVVSGRDNTSDNVDDIVGLFINSIPVRIKFDRSTTVRQALSQLQKQNAASNDFDHCALEQIQKQTSLGSDLFQSVFAFENYNSGKEETNTESLLIPVDIREEIFDDINPVAMIDNGKLVFAVSYNTERYRESEIKRISAMIGTLVKEITEHPDSPLSELELLDSNDKADVLELSKGETLGYDKRGTWVDLFRAQAEKTPERNAVTDSEGSFTYRELDKVSDSIAAYLLDKDVKPNTFIAIKMGRSKLFLAAVLGIHKAGAAYLPIDADYPEERISYMLEDSETSIVLTEDAVRAAIAGYENAEPINLAENGSLAYMIYTSGSTGKPKGVMIPHRAMLNFVHFIRYRWKLTENSRIACHSNFSFDASVESLYPALTIGGCVFIVPEKERHDVFEMRKYISDNSINGGCYTTQFGQLLSDKEPLVLDYLCVGGEAMTSVPNVRGSVFNAYGPTEFTVIGSYYELDKTRKYDSIPIGRPITNCYDLIVGLHGELLPRGIAGELCLAGPQIAEGYWKREELTTEKFVNCPYLEGQKMYRTGDLARYNEEGQLEYLGRIDTQVKLRGFRIELGEIESRASQFAGIKSAAAEVRKDNLVLYYTSENEIDNNKLKSFLSESLTEYMIPSVYMRLSEMPFTPNGKIDRKALPEPDLSSLKAEYEAPRNETEKKLCDAFAEVLGIDKDSVGINDDFIMLGGSSIKSMRLTVIAGIDGLVVNDIYRLKTPKNIAKELLGRGAANYALDEAEARKKAVPATIGQISMVDYQFANLNSVMYNMPVLYEIDSSIDEQRLTEAVNAVIGNHPALSTQFEMGSDGVIIQRYKPGSISAVSIETIHDNDIQSVIDELVQPFRIFNSPLFRARIFRCGEKLYLFMDMHHAISDGASMDILFYNIYSAYQGEPLKPDNYYSFVLNESRMSETDRFREAQEHFRSVLGDTEWCCIPVPDHESWETEPAEQTVLTGLTADDIKSAESRLGVSGNVMCITAGILALTRYCDNSDIHVNWDYSNRSDSRYQNTVGRLFKILPVAVHTGDYGILSDLINEVNRQVSEGIANSMCNYAELTEATLSDAMEINYLFDFDDKMFLETTGFRSVDADFEFSAVGEHLAIYIFEQDGEMAALADYQAKAYEEGSIVRFLQMFREHLRKIVLEGTENIEQTGKLI